MVKDKYDPMARANRLILDLLLMRRNYLGDRGENESQITESENDLMGDNNEETEQEPINDDGDQPPPLEDIDDEEEENEMEDSATESVPMPTIIKENDTGRSISIERLFNNLFIRYPIYPATITKRCDTFVIRYDIRSNCKYVHISLLF